MRGPGLAQAQREERRPHGFGAQARANLHSPSTTAAPHCEEANDYPNYDGSYHNDRDCLEPICERGDSGDTLSYNRSCSRVGCGRVHSNEDQHTHRDHNGQHYERDSGWSKKV